MSSTEREAARGIVLSDDRAKEIGVDDYANPGVGDAYVSVSAPPPIMGGYKFHFATVIMDPGQDRVTLENEGTTPGVRKPEVEDRDIQSERQAGNLPRNP